MNFREQYNKTTTLKARFTMNGVPVLNATGKIYIFRQSDLKYFVGLTWQTARQANAMIELGDTEHPGYQYFEFDNTSDNALEVDQYVFEIIDDSGNSNNKIELFEQYVGGYIDPIIADIKRLLGLEHHNIVVAATSIESGKMTAGDVYLYDTPSNTAADGRTTSTGVVHAYHIEAPLSGGDMTKFSQWEIAVAP